MRTITHKQGGLVISLDYELLWGGIEKRFPEDYGRSNVQNVEIVLKELTSLFEKYGVHATIAIVGLIMRSNKEEALLHEPSLKPSYRKSVLSPYNNDYIKKIKKEDENLYFAPQSVLNLKESNCFEIGTHTYCHYYCWEEGQTLEEFDADLQSAIDAAQKFDIKLESIIFPRNEVKESYLRVCSSKGIKVYRGNPKHFFKEKKGRISRLIQRFLRIADNYINISGHNAFSIDELEDIEGCVNVPASRFLRPYCKKLRILDFLRIYRIRKDIRYAAKHNLIYHLWWHPHNFGSYTRENLAVLEHILKEYKSCKNQYGMNSYTMKEVQTLRIK